MYMIITKNHSEQFDFLILQNLMHFVLELTSRHSIHERTSRYYNLCRKFLDEVLSHLQALLFEPECSFYLLYT